jgi:hypothetical protein
MALVGFTYLQRTLVNLFPILPFPVKISPNDNEAPSYQQEGVENKARRSRDSGVHD